MEGALFRALILFNGLFAMSEIALVTARKSRLQKMVDDGDPAAAAAAAAVKPGEGPTRFLSAIQIGITSISVLNGIVGEAVLAEPLGIWLDSLGMMAPCSSYAATGLVVVVVITCLTIVIGERVPKRIGQISWCSMSKRRSPTTSPASNHPTTRASWW